MSQFFVPRKNLRGTHSQGGNFFVFPPSESRHLSQVLRKKQGDIVQIFDGHGFVSDAEIIDISDSNAVKAKLFPISFPHSPFGKGMDANTPSRLNRDTPLAKGNLQTGYVKGENKGVVSLHLYPALIRNERFEWMLEKVTELGVSSIHPILTQRTIVKLPPARFQTKVKRWEKILLSAAKQCGRETLPAVFSPIKFNEAIQQCKNDSMNLLLWEGEEKNLLSNFLTPLPLRERACPELDSGIEVRGKEVNLFIGPEGGFTIEEVNAAKRSGIKSVRLGENILRAETAILAAVSLILVV